MKKIKLDSNELEKVYGGKLYDKLIDLDVNEPIAIANIDGWELAFNPSKKSQVTYIIKSGNHLIGGPIVYGMIDLDPNFVRTYTLENIHKCYSIPYRWFYKLLI